jgi:hypothetical protein
VSSVLVCMTSSWAQLLWVSLQWVQNEIYGCVINTKIGGRHVNAFDFVDKAHHIHNIFISSNGC